MFISIHFLGNEENQHLLRCSLILEKYVFVEKSHQQDLFLKMTDTALFSSYWPSSCCDKEIRSRNSKGY